MKRNVLFTGIVLAAFSLMAFSYVSWNNDVTDSQEVSYDRSELTKMDLANLFSKRTVVNFVYDVDSRFLATITKEDLHNAKSIIDIVPKKATKSLQSYQKVRVSILTDGKDKMEVGVGETLNPAQLELIQSIDYSTNFYIEADCLNKTAQLGALVNYDLVYYMTVIPETEAEYRDGHDALIDYLKENSKSEAVSVDMRQLQPGKVNFIVTKDGGIGAVTLESTSGYNSIDKKMINLIKSMPGTWEPATNEKGERVDQELVFSFGMMGC